MDDLKTFGELLDNRSLELLTTSGPKLIQSIGLNSVREIVADVLSGKNLRDSTELLTRGRLATLNASLLRLFLEGERRQSDFIQKIPEHAERILARGRLTRAEKWIAQWMLGLTDKASQNVLRDDASLEFWLSSRDEKRESDATALWRAGKGARFDIGFIGRGNPEISLDKITRFDREIRLGRSTWYMATIIIVDRIGARSRIPELAKMIDGDIVQMSMAYWPQEVARLLRDRMGFTHPLITMRQTEIGPYLKRELAKVDLMQFIQVDLNGAKSAADEEVD